MITRNDKGYPLSDDGSIDWALTAQDKELAVANWEKKSAKRRKTRSKMSNFTKPKKRRK